MRPVFFFGTFALVFLLVYGYYRILIDTRRKGYIEAAGAALSIASDRLGSELANLQSVVARADVPYEALSLQLPASRPRTGDAQKDKEWAYFDRYVDVLIPDLDPTDCKFTLAQPEQNQTQVYIFAAREQNATRAPTLIKRDRVRLCFAGAMAAPAGLEAATPVVSTEPAAAVPTGSCACCSPEEACWPTNCGLFSAVCERIEPGLLGKVAVSEGPGFDV